MSNRHKLIILFLIIISLVLSSVYIPLFFGLLFWMGGLLVIPGIILIVSYNSFQGSILNKILLSILPWSIFLILSYIYVIKDSTDALAPLLNHMIILSLFFGLTITIIYNKFLKPKIKTKEIVDEVLHTNSDGKEAYIALGFIVAVFAVIFVSSWIYYFINKLIT